jgi:DNA-binding MarR family transcriptional regulator
LKSHNVALTSDHDIGGNDLDHLIGYNLKRVYMIFIAEFRSAQAKNGLSTRSYSALSLIVGKPGITQSEIARKLGIERSGLVAIIDDLQARGYAVRAPVEGDRRVQALSPTEAGRAAYDAATAALKSNEEHLLSALTEKEQAAFRSILVKIRNAYEGDPE